MTFDKSNKYIPNPFFLALVLFYCFAGVFVLFLTERGDVVLWVNSFSSVRIDHLFLFITFLGDGLFALLISVVFLFKKLYYAFMLGVTFLIVAVFTNILKHFVFIHFNRPLWNFYYDDFHRVVLDAPVNYLFSFPSGHTMTAFALVAALSMIVKNKILLLVFFIYALLVSLSRIYLCQHYFVDVFWGTVFGVLSAILGKLLLDNLLKFLKLDFMELSIQKAVSGLFTQFKH